MKPTHFVIFLSSLGSFGSFGCATTDPAVDPVAAKDYRRAESFLAVNTTPLVSGVLSRPTWGKDGRLVYQCAVPGGIEFVVVDPVARTKARAFDHQKLAEALSSVTLKRHEALRLPFSQFEYSKAGGSIHFSAFDQRFSCDLGSYRCSSEEDVHRRWTRDAMVSPDGKKAAFRRDDNLWVRDLASGEETALTSDGVADFGYATNNAGWTRGDGPVLLWSPDSTKIATFQHDGRKVGWMHTVSTEVGHSKLESWRCPLPGDEHIFMLHRVVVHLDGGRIVRLQMPPDAHRSTIRDHVAARGGVFLDVEWSEDSASLAFVSSSRDHKSATLRLADPETGMVRDVLNETVPTYFESGNGRVNWHVLGDSGEVIWFSERDDRGHLYLYDDQGHLTQPITKGDWSVLQVLRIDRASRRIYFTASGREAGDPYFHYLYRINIDGSGVELLTPEPAHHSVTLSPEGDFFVDSYSTPAEPPVAVLRSLTGELLLELETADISRLLVAGWQPPIPFTTKARDGETDLFGLMYKPSRFDPTRHYPILNYLYPGPQSGSVGSRSFRPSRGDKQSLAELGFIVVEVDAMGTPGRSKPFHDAYYGNMGDNGLPDQIATIRQLAERHPWMDLDRVGIWGHSGGGFASTAGILRYPDFYKVAVSGAGNHDNRNYEDDWGEKWQGLLVEQVDGTTNYDNQANQLVAGSLKGKLLLAHGTLDSNVPASNTLLVANALIAANKDFDLLLLPNRGHGFSSEAYMMRRRWDYFVRHLIGVDPPEEYVFQTDTRRR